MGVGVSVGGADGGLVRNTTAAITAISTSTAMTIALVLDIASLDIYHTYILLILLVLLEFKCISLILCVFYNVMYVFMEIRVADSTKL